MADLPSTAGKSRGDLILHEGTWRILHHPYGSGQQAQWVFDEATNNFLRSLDARRVTGSGDNMKIYAGQGEDEVVLDMGRQEDIDVYRNLYQGMLDTQSANAQSVSQSAMSQGAPVDLKGLWDDIYPNIPFPDLWAIDEYGDIATNKDGDYVTDASKYNEVIEALEARVGSLTQYGLDKDAGYQVVELGDQYESDIVISDGKVTKINKTTGAQAPAYTPGLRPDISEQMPGYDVLQQPTGQLSTVQQRVDPGYIIDPQTMQPYFQQPDGSLQAAPIPSVDDQISMHLVEGNMDAAVNKANFRDRPSSLEYFNAAMEWARTPADIFTISAIVRGVMEPTPGPMGELRRVGAPPAWASQAWVGLQNSMGIPVESMTSGPGAEPGSVNEMMVASSSGLVPNNFIAANSSATTLDGGKTVNPPPTANIMGDTTVQALDDAGNVVGSMTADAANQFGFGYAGQDGPSDFATAMGSAGTSTEVMAETAIDDPRTGTSWNLTEFEAGGLDDRMNQIEAAGGVLQADGSYLGPNGERWDAEGFSIETSSEPRDQFDIQAEWQADPANAALIAEANALRDTIIEDDAPSLSSELDPRLIQARIDLGLDPDTGMWAEDADIEPSSPNIWDYDEFGLGTSLYPTPSASASTLPAWMMGDEGIDIEGPLSGFGPGLSSEFRESMEMKSRGAPIYSKAEWGTDRDGNPIVIKPAEIIGYEPEDRMGQAEMDVRTGKLPSEDFLGSEGPGAFGSDIEFLTGVLPEKRQLPFEDTDPLPVGPANISTPRMTPTSTVGTHGSGPGGYYHQRSEPARVIQAYDPDPTISEEYEWFDVPEATPTISEDYEWFDSPAPEPEPVYEPVTVYEEFEEDAGSGYQYIAPEPEPEPEYASRWYDEGAKGTRTGDRFTLVGEEGPELALFPRGTEIVPLNRPTKPKQRRRLRSQFSDAIDSFAFGGFSSGGPALVGEMGPELVDLPPGAQVMPAGITEMMTGRPTRAPRSLFRQAGMRAPSAQTIANLLPEEIEVYQEMGRLAGIPDKAFEREFRSIVPMGQGGTRQARFTPRGTGRTRYGSI